MARDARRRLSRSLIERGASALLFVLALAPILGLAGAAVDLAGAQLARARMQDALDSAVLAAARSDARSLAERRVVVQRHFDAETAGLFVETPCRIALAEFDGALRASVSGGYRTRFLPAIGVDWIALAPLSQAAPSRGVAVVLDLTGFAAGSDADGADVPIRAAGLPVGALFEDAPGDASPDPDDLAYVVSWGRVHALRAPAGAAEAIPDALWPAASCLDPARPVRECGSP